MFCVGSHAARNGAQTCVQFYLSSMLCVHSLESCWQCYDLHRNLGVHRRVPHLWRDGDSGGAQAEMSAERAWRSDVAARRHPATRRHPAAAFRESPEVAA